VEFCEADPTGFHWGIRILLKEKISVSFVSRAQRVVNQFGPFRTNIMPPFLGVVVDFHPSLS